MDTNIHRKPVSLLDLPPELGIMICKHLSWQEQGRLAKVCRRTREWSDEVKSKAITQRLWSYFPSEGDRGLKEEGRINFLRGRVSTLTVPRSIHSIVDYTLLLPCLGELEKVWEVKRQFILQDLQTNSVRYQKLQKLDLTFTKNDDLSFVGQFPRLRELHLDLKGQPFPIEFIGGRCLQKLSVVCVGIKMKSLKNLSDQCPELRELKLTDSQNFTCEPLGKIRSNLFLGLSLNRKKITQKGIVDLLNRFPHLLYFEMTTEDLEHFLCQCPPELKTLTVIVNKRDTHDLKITSGRFLKKLHLIFNLYAANHSETIFLNGWPELQELNLHGHNGSSINLSINGCRHLHELKLWGFNQITEAGLKPCWRDFFQLRKLTLLDCRIEVGDFNFEDCGQLQEVRLFARNITSEDVQHLLKSGSSLRKLNVGGGKLKDHLDFSECRSLQKVHLFHSEKESVEKSVQNLLRNCPELRELNLQRCQQIKNIDFSGCGNLRKVWLSGTSITDKSMQSLLNACSRLQILELSGCHQLNNLDCIGGFHLQRLNLSGCRQLTTAILEQILRRCPHLRELILLGNVDLWPMLPDFKHCVHMQKLALVGAAYHFDGNIESDKGSWSEKRISQESIINILKNCPSLQKMLIVKILHIEENIVPL